MVLAFIIGALLQQGTYEVAHKGLHFDKSDALAMSLVTVGLGVGLYQMMDIPPGPQFTHTALNKSIPPWLGMATAAGVTIAIPGL
jgi:hypothetical protein